MTSLGIAYYFACHTVILATLLATFSAAIRSLISDTFFGVISVIKYFFVVRDSVFVLLLSVFVNFVRCVVIFVVR